MSLSNPASWNPEAMRMVGVRALEDARLAGVPVYYTEKSYPGGIVREFPDGHRELITRETDAVIRSIPPRA